MAAPIPVLAPVMTITGSSATERVSSSRRKYPGRTVDATEARFPRVRASNGHYESFYLKACHPEEPLGVWIRYTVHKKPDEEPTAAVWFTFFEAGADGGPVAAKESGAVPVAGEGGWVRVGDASGIGDGRAFGWAGNAWWELSFESDEEPLFHLSSDWMYRAPLPKTKLCSPLPAARFSGRMGVGDRQISLDGWRGMVGHNWGAEHAERWIWLHWVTDEGDWLDVAIGRVIIGGDDDPVDRERRRVPRGRAPRDRRPPRLRHPRGARRVRVPHQRPRDLGAGDVRAPIEDTVGWVYADPAGGEHHSLNCSIADMLVRIEPKERPHRAFEIRGSAAYELGVREDDHGVKIQPFPDG